MRRREAWSLIRAVCPFGMASAAYAFMKAPAPESDPEATSLTVYAVWRPIYEVHPPAVLFTFLCIGLFVLASRSVSDPS